MAGLALPPGLGVTAHLCGSGRLGAFMPARLATVQVAADAGITRLYMADYDAERLGREMSQLPQHEVPQGVQVSGLVVIGGWLVGEGGKGERGDVCSVRPPDLL